MSKTNTLTNKQLTLECKKHTKLIRKLNKSTELKYIDSSINDSNVSYDNVSIDTFNDVAQGLGDSQRVGDRLFMTSFDFKFVCGVDNSSAGNIRVIIIYDKANTITSWADLMVNDVDTQRWLSSFTVDRRKEFIVLKDMVINCDGTHYSKQFRRVKKKINKITSFSSGTTTIEVGALKMFFTSDVANAATNKPFLQGYLRINYQDS